MCITFFRLTPEQPLSFILAFNRDQNSNRKTLPLGPFDEDPNIYAGRDMEAGGSWLGVNVKTGLLVALTNYRQYIWRRRGKSRGLLVKHFLDSDYVRHPFQTPGELSQQIYKDMTRMLQTPSHYSPHNLMVYNIRDGKMFYMCSETKMVTPYVLTQGTTHGFSNTDIDNKWTKVERGKELFQQCLGRIGKQLTSNEHVFRQLEQVMRDRSGACCCKGREASIYVSQYYSPLLRTFRKTKSTCYVIVRKKSAEKYQLQMREVTYNQQQQQSKVEFIEEI